MPAKTVKDLIEFNNNVAKQNKVGINIELLSLRRLMISFCFLENGESIDQRNPIRLQYYNTDHTKAWEVDKESLPGMGRYKDPESSKPLFPWGFASCSKNTKKQEYPCHNSWIIGTTQSAKGYGPMLYDCLLAKLGEYKIGLIADRHLVSNQAATVWYNYFTTRSDIIKKPLDLDGSTTEKEDDCYSEHENDPEWNTWTKYTEETKDRHATIRQAVNHAYFDNGIKTLDELRKAGLIYRETSYDLGKLLENVTSYYHENNQLLQKLYKSILKG